jgi:serine O-acetyltransferase
MQAFRRVDDPLTLEFQAYDALSVRECVRSDVAAMGGLRSALWSYGFWATLSYRVSHALFRAGGRLPALLIQLTGQLLFRGDISRKATIGPSFVVCHPAGVFIGPHCRIGKGCTVGMGAFIGSNMHSDDPRDYPTIGDKVSVGPTACIMGPVFIGAECRIGPSAVVLRSVPPNHVVMPAAARVVSRQRLSHLSRHPAQDVADEPATTRAAGVAS